MDGANVCKDSAAPPIEFNQVERKREKEKKEEINMKNQLIGVENFQLMIVCMLARKANIHMP